MDTFLQLCLPGRRAAGVYGVGAYPRRWMPARMTLSGCAHDGARRVRGTTVTQEFSDYQEAETEVRPIDPGSDR